MRTDYNEVYPQTIRKLPRTNDGDSGNQSAERSRPGCSLHQGASFWNDDPAGAAPGRKTGTRLCKPQHWTLSPKHTRRVHLATAHRGKRWNGHRPQGLFQGRNS